MRKWQKGRKTNSPPPGEPWQWLTLDLLNSKAWKKRSIGCVRLIEFLMIEHLRNGAKDNGNLKAPYSQLVEFGISRKLIAAAIVEAEQRGLIRVERGGKKGTCMTEVSRFRLTFAWTNTKADGLWTWQEPTDDWHTYKDKIGAQRGTVPVPKGELVPVPKGELSSSQVIEIANGTVVPKGEPLSISGVYPYPPPRKRGRRGLPS